MDREPGSFIADADGKIIGPNPDDEAMKARQPKDPKKKVKEEDNVKR